MSHCSCSHSPKPRRRCRVHALASPRKDVYRKSSMTHAHLQTLLRGYCRSMGWSYVSNSAVPASASLWTFYARKRKGSKPVLIHLSHRELAEWVKCHHPSRTGRSARSKTMQGSPKAFSSSPRRVSKDQMSFMFEAPAAPPSRIRTKPAKKAAKKVTKKRSSLGMSKLVPYRISGDDMRMLQRIEKAKPSRKGRHKGHRRWEVWSREGGKLTHKAASFQRKDRAELMARESRRLFVGSYSIVDSWRRR